MTNFGDQELELRSSSPGTPQLPNSMECTDFDNFLKRCQNIQTTSTVSAEVPKRSNAYRSYTM